ncbi:hypothetical protein AX14_002011 [Amanita brunnescens Koide BX004]|nr:hypothetical protein AX14_002011 [Amanita brunnescens Koide BX004]
MIYEGAIGQSLKKHFITALRLPLHPSAGKPNEPYNKDKKSPLSNAALLFVHGGMAPVPSQAQWLAGFPKDINEVSADLLKKMQTLNPLPKKVPFKLPSFTPAEMLLLHRKNGPLWYRGWNSKKEPNCNEVDKILRKTGTRRMIMGHCAHPDQVVTWCNKKIIFIDTGISEGYLAALSIQFRLERDGEVWIENEILRIIKGKGLAEPLLEEEVTHKDLKV